MKSYIQIIKSTISEYMVYRLNFVMWRFRIVLQLLIVYFLWTAIFSGQDNLFGYTRSMMLTYILLTAIVRTTVLGTTTHNIGRVINQGELSILLLKPFGFFKYYFARDLGDKALNILFSGLELIILILVLKPPIVIQHDILIYVWVMIALIIGIVLYFFFNVVIGLLGFWVPDVWSIRFLSFVVMEFFAGGLFPLDILPKPLFALSQSLPFYYFIFFPIRIYLGGVTGKSIVYGIFVGIIWIIIFNYIKRIIWRKGLRMYSAQGI